MWTVHGGWFWVVTLGVFLGAILLLAIVHQTSNNVKRILIAGLTFLGGLFYFLEFFIPPDPGSEETILFGWSLSDTATVLGNAVQVVAGFTFLLGLYNLVRIHGNQIRRRRPDWPYSLAFFVALVTMAVAAFWRDWHTWFGNPNQPVAPRWIHDRDPAHAGMPHDLYTLLFEGLLRNLDATMFSILAFYIVSAAYRAFRIRSGEAAVLMVVALILMLGQVPVGMALTHWIPPDSAVSGLRIENLSQYLLTAVNAPVQRAIGFGLGLGALAMSLRIWLSLERGTYFSQEV